MSRGHYQQSIGGVILCIILLCFSIPAQAGTFEIPAGDTAALIAALDAAALQPNVAHTINLASDSLYTLTEINNSQLLIDDEIMAYLPGGTRVCQ